MQVFNLKLQGKRDKVSSVWCDKLVHDVCLDLIVGCGFEILVPDAAVGAVALACVVEAGVLIAVLPLALPDLGVVEWSLCGRLELLQV